ncbi:hypothetical protein ACRAWD_06400 [Caulobacter segnis]
MDRRVARPWHRPARLPAGRGRAPALVLAGLRRPGSCRPKAGTVTVAADALTIGEVRPNAPISTMRRSAGRGRFRPDHAGGRRGPRAGRTGRRKRRRRGRRRPGSWPS